jgi:hypothetical protein
MGRNILGVAGVLLFAVFVTSGISLSHNWFGGAPQNRFPIIAAFFLAIVTPMTIIAIRHQIRLNRIKLIELFARNFHFESPAGEPVPAPAVQAIGAAVAQPDAASRAAAAQASAATSANVSFEFVKGKYFADLDLDEDREPTIRDVPRFPMMLHADWMLLLCALPYMVLCWFGAFLLFSPLIEVMRLGAGNGVGSWLWPSMLAIGGLSLTDLTDNRLFNAWHVNVLTVALLAFAGGYFYTLRLLLRAVAVFDLSPITFLRAFAHVLLAMLLAVVIYRVVPSADAVSEGFRALRVGLALERSEVTPAEREAKAEAGAPAQAPGPAPEAPAAPEAAEAPAAPAAPARPGAVRPCPGDVPCPSGDPTKGVSGLWLIVAFALGFIPDAAIQYVLHKSGLAFKARYSDVEDHTKQIPPTILDGIDHFIAFRLEEANIFDVQNLAASNPIMLHIESPYGIYETIDWVAQAQLCTIVGPDRFLLFKTLNIRTIFDLERAVGPVLSMPASEAQAKDATYADADEALVLMIGRVLLRDNARDIKLRRSFALGGPLLDMEKAVAEKAVFVATTKALVGVLIDDLHVHRLRQIWKHIALQLKPENAHLLNDTGKRTTAAAAEERAADVAPAPGRAADVAQPNPGVTSREGG